jgi:hypothetical protein
MRLAAKNGVLREDRDLCLPFEYTFREGFQFGNEMVMKYQVRDGSGLCVCTTYHEEMAKKLCEMLSDEILAEQYDSAHKETNKNNTTKE